jgi:glycosyltransferase involved in cell wall biosynthesis
MRLAWLGAAPTDSGGVNGVATQLLRGLARLGVEIDVYLSSDPSELPQVLHDQPGLRFVHITSDWEWDRWYSRTPLTQFASGLGARAAGQVRLARLIAERHRTRRYDFVYQFSQIELFAVRALRRQLPPIVLHPETHAQGELAGLRNEHALARRFEAPWRLAAVRGLMIARAGIQRSDIRHADRVIAISDRFGRHLVDDYGISRDRVAVVPNPIEVDRFASSANGRGAGRPQRLLFVSRLSVRKGVEMIVALSHALRDLEGEVNIEVAGGPSLWSDYSPMLEEMNPAVGRFVGYLDRRQLTDTLATSAGLLAPSHFEPFGLTVGEALAAGVPVVASDQVGAVEGVDPRVCMTFPARDGQEFERAVRRLLSTAAGPDGATLAGLARSEAARLFDPATVAQGIVDALNAP